MPKLQVLAGPSLQSLTRISTLVNKNVPFRISTAEWEGEITVFIKGFNDGDPSSGADAEYFSRPDRQGITWSIQVQGRFLSPRSADDILFGNVFERPLQLPWGTGAALQFMKYIDPTLSHDLTCTATRKPWALSPLVATMPHFEHARLPLGETPPPFPPSHSIADETSSLHLCSHARRSSTPSSINSSSSTSSSSSRGSIFSKRIRSKSRGSKSPVEVVPQGMTAQQRRSFFSDEGHRKSVTFGPQDVITTDFCYGFLEFSPSLRLRLPGGLGFDLARYWDGQGVRFVCCERRHDTVADDADVHHDTDFSGKRDDSRPADDQSDPWGPVFWCVSIEMADE